MTRWLIFLSLLAGLPSTFAQPPKALELKPSMRDANTRFEPAKVFALTALDERIRILESERRCVAAAVGSEDLRACNRQARSARKAMRNQLNPSFEHLKSGTTSRSH